MGNDGGSIPKRRELVKNGARAPTVSELKATALESLSHAWTQDPLTSSPLDLANSVSDWRGRLYNYESVLQGLIPDNASDAKEGGDSAEGHQMSFASTGIKSIRDVVKLKFKRYAAPASESSNSQSGKQIWACPVSLKELGPGTKSVYLVPCGHVFAEVAIREIKEQERQCPECSEPFTESNVIPILPTDPSELEKLQQRIDDLRASGLSHSLKKAKSNGKKKRKADDKQEDTKDGPADKIDEEKKGERRGKEGDAGRLSGINNAMTASLTAKVLAEQEERNKRRKLAMV